MAMNLKMKKITAAVLIATTLTASVAQAASVLDKAMDGMFANLTSGGVVQTPDRNAFVGGGLAVRVPTSTVNLAVFDPPRMSAGCGGFDLFGGSFSFINADQLVALFRKIAANAVGLAFKAAIEAINPELGKLMGEFQKLVNDLNGQAKNSCMLAQGLLGAIDFPSSSQIQSMIPDVSSALKSASGMATDWLAGILKTTDDGVAKSQDEVKKLDMSYGNGVWTMINSKKLGSMLTDFTGNSTSDKKTNEILMSIIGMYVNKASDEGESSSGAPLNNTGNGSYVHLIDIADLERGSSPDRKLEKYVCDTDYIDDSNPTCVNVTREKFDFIGMQGYVKQTLIGDDTHTGVIEALQTSSPLTSDQQKLLKYTNVPVMGLLGAVGDNPQAMRQVLVYATPVISKGMLVNYLIAVQKAAQEIKRNPTAPMQREILERIDYLYKESERLALSQNEDVKSINEMTQYVESVHKYNPSTFYATRFR